MRRLALSLLTVLLLAACAGAPQKTSRGPGSSVVVTNGAYHAPPPGFPIFVDHSIGREEISIQAMSLVGIPYRWGGNTPDSGFDCSGLVRYVVSRAASVNLPRTTADMSGRGESIEPDQIAPGDLIFFTTTGRAHSHVGIYVGKLRFVNAPSTGGTVRLDYNPVPVVDSDLVNEPFSTMICAFCADLISTGLPIPGTPSATFVVPSTDSAGNSVKLLVIRYVSAACTSPVVGITASVPANAVSGVTQTITFIPLQEENTVGGTETTILAPPGSTVGFVDEPSDTPCLLTMNGYLAH